MSYSELILNLTPRAMESLEDAIRSRGWATDPPEVATELQDAANQIRAERQHLLDDARRGYSRLKPGVPPGRNEDLL